MLNIGLVDKRVYSTFNSVNYQSTLSNLVSLTPPPKLYLFVALYNTDNWLNILVSFFKESAYLLFSKQMSSAYRE